MDPAEAAALLGVHPGATEADIRSAYRSAISARHPDRAGSASTAEAVRVIEAYRVLRAAGTVPPKVRPPSASGPPPSGPGQGHANAARFARPAVAPTAIVRVADDTIAFGAPADETLLLLLEAAHDLGELTYLDRSMPIIEVICQFAGTPTLSLVITLQGRCDGTEAFCTVESIEAEPGPPAAAVVDVLLDLLLQRQALSGR